MTPAGDPGLEEQQRLVARNPRDVIALHNLGVELRKRDRLDEALEVIRRAVAFGAKAPETHAVYGHLLGDFGQFEEAVTQYHRVLDTYPDFIDAHETLARLLPQIGRRGDAFAAYRKALIRAPGSGPLWLSALSAAKDLRDADELLALVRAAQTRFGPEPMLAILAAQAQMWRGNDSEAKAAINAAIAAEPDNAAGHATLAQIHIRGGDIAAAETSALTAARLAPDDQSGWALLTVIWRLMGDPREYWLADYDRFVMEFDLDGIDLPETTRTLTQLHCTVEHPAEQSLRGGTQTRGILFDKIDPAIRDLRDRISVAISTGLAVLRDDRGHPFLRRKSAHFAFAGSWSVRLRSEGHHISHIHQAGWLSSAVYIDLPPEVSGSTAAGALTFGVPEALLGLDLPPRRVVAPLPGKLVLFPSYFWHGTLPFTSAAPRLTVAFDALPVDSPAGLR